MLSPFKSAWLRGAGQTPERHVAEHACCTQRAKAGGLWLPADRWRPLDLKRAHMWAASLLKPFQIVFMSLLEVNTQDGSSF